MSTGEVERHGLSRADNRKLNSALHHAALSHKRTDEAGIAHYARKLADGKGKKGALRCMKRRLSDAVYRALVEDTASRGGGPGRTPGGDSHIQRDCPIPDGQHFG